MDLKNLQLIFEEIMSSIDSDPATEFDFFKSTFFNLTYEEKEVLKPLLYRRYLNDYNDDKSPILRQLRLSEIMFAIRMDDDVQSPNSRLTLTDKVRDVQIAKFFYDLKTHGCISDSIEQIASAISNFFNLNFATILSYLSNPEKLGKAKPLF